MRDLSEEDKELAARAMFMTAFELTIKSCREMGLDYNSILVGMVSTMTIVIRELFKQIKEEEN